MSNIPRSSTPKPPPLRDLTSSQREWIGGGFVMCFASVVGQTTFIALFNPSLRAEFGFSHGELGLFYTAITLLSSLVLVWAGELVDKISARRLSVFVVLGMAIMAIGMSQAQNVVWLAVTLFGVRFLGQGMSVQIVMTSMARWFNRYRGRSTSLSMMGFSLAEATLPFTVTVAIGLYDWRLIWLVAAFLLAVVIAPLIGFFWRDPPDGKKAKARGATNPDAVAENARTGEQWTRANVLRDPIFYALVPGFMMTPAILSLIIFHQAHLAESKGWELSLFTAFFPIFSGSALVASLTGGGLVDRFGAFRLLPFQLLPMAAGLILLTVSDHWLVIPSALMLFGITGGIGAPMGGALWAEIYGTVHIGAIRAMVMSTMVFASALGPGLAGYLIDQNITLTQQALGYAAASIFFGALYATMRGTLRNRASQN